MNARLLFAALLASALAAPHVDAAPVAPDYAFMPLPSASAVPGGPARKFLYMFGAPARWIGPYVWKYNPTNQPGFASDTSRAVAQISAGFDRWTQQCGFTHRYAGETPVPPNNRSVSPIYGEQPDGENVIGWDVLTGNTAGLTYLWYQPTVVGGARPLMDGDIVLDPRYLAFDPSLDRAVTHEIGHALGLAHSDQSGALMSGPPFSSYNGLAEPGADDVRGCRCLYGPATGQSAGYACSLPSSLDFGLVPVGAFSTQQQLTLTNAGNGPLAITSIVVTGSEFRRIAGCDAGTTLLPGQSCTVTVAVVPSTTAVRFAELRIGGSDGPYRVGLFVEGLVPGVLQPGQAELVEYYHAAFDHYFITASPAEIDALDRGVFAGWMRTGQSMKVYLPGAGNGVPVCRFFSTAFAPKSSHFYTANPIECAGVKANPDWSYEGQVFEVGLPGAGGNCAGGQRPVYRLYNDGHGAAPNHRFTTDPTVRQQMMERGWVPEGDGGVAMCVPG